MRSWRAWSTPGRAGVRPRSAKSCRRFCSPTATGRLVSLERLLARSPVVIAFHRGHWCPICRLNAVGLSEVQELLKPVEIVAISAETERFTQEIRTEAGARFPFLTDIANGYALANGLAVFIDPAMSSLIESAGWDVPAYQGGTGWILPIPSVYLVGQDGRILARHVDADYRRRLEPYELLAMVGAALPSTERARNPPEPQLAPLGDAAAASTR